MKPAYRMVGLAPGWSELLWSSGGGVPPWRHKPNCRMSKKSCPIFIVYLLYKNGQGFWTYSNCATHGKLYDKRLNSAFFLSVESFKIQDHAVSEQIVVKFRSN